MRKLIATLVILAIITALFLLLSADDELHPEVAAWLANPAENSLEANNGYIYLVGIMVAEKDDPHESGLQTLESYSNRLQGDYK